MALLDEIKAMAQLFERSNCVNLQKTYYKDMAKNAKVVKVVKAEDVLEQYQLNHIKKVLKPEIRQCYRNAHLLTCCLPGFTYCEGKVAAPFEIDHAFNKYTDVNGNEYYIDITFEFALHEDPTKYEYVVLGEYDEKKITEVSVKTGVYGVIYKYLWREEHASEFPR